MKVNIFWFRRDLRLEDNTGLSEALKTNIPVLPIFIFDTDILRDLHEDDARVQFIFERIIGIRKELTTIYNSNIQIYRGRPEDIFKDLFKKYKVDSLFLNTDYEPYARTRDEKISQLCTENGVQFQSCKDQYIFEPGEILKSDGKPYTVFTPFKKKWLESFEPKRIELSRINGNFIKNDLSIGINSLSDIGFKPNNIKVKPYTTDRLSDYAALRNYPGQDASSYLSPHLRFGTVSIRKIVAEFALENEIFLSELIWREFFMQILYFFPHVISESFKPKYDKIVWRNDPHEFEAWCEGKTGYPMVDAGMRELNETGYMHNRVRMVTASFLCKHLLIDWRWGEAYFAEKLLDFELASNNGNWQWAAGSGCDAAPYFRVFNPTAQLEKFDKQNIYVRKWLPELDSFEYTSPIVEHKFARERALKAYASALTD